MAKIIDELRNVAALENAAFGGNGPVPVRESVQEEEAANAYRYAAYNLGHADLLKAVEALQEQPTAPAPATDALLGELEISLAEAAPVRWGVHVSEYDDVLIFEDENGDGMRPNPYHPICQMEDMGDEKQEAYAVLIKNLVNAAPALLARVRAANTKTEQLEAELALAQRRGEEFKALATWYSKNTDNLGRPTFEDLIKEGYLSAAPTVKGGQPHA